MAVVPCVHLLWLQTLTQPTLHQKTETRHTVHKVKDGFVCTIFPFFFKYRSHDDIIIANMCSLLISVEEILTS